MLQSVFVTVLCRVCLSNSHCAFQTSLSSIRTRIAGNSFADKMAKFFKSIFQATDKKKEEEVDDDRNITPPGSRRQLSISRSGRMRQANKKRHSLTLELYGDTIDIDVVEKPTSREYHVNNPVNHTAPAALGNNDNRLENDTAVKNIPDEIEIENSFQINLENKLSALAVETVPKSPEEEIDTAFEIIDKS